MALVLIADDSAPMRRMVRRMLSAAGHEVIEAEDGGEALRLVERDKPALLVTDLVMPGKEGIETIIAIRRKGLATKILAITGNDPEDRSIYLDAAHKLGADAVMRKPFGVTEFTKMVEQLLGAS